MYTTGYDRNYIVRYLNDQGFTTGTGKKFDSDGVKYILENPFYIGKIRWNRRENSGSSKYKDESEWIIADSFHEPIIDLDTWNAAQERTALLLKAREQYAHPVSHTKHWLSGIVKCPICGKSLSYKHGYLQKRAKNLSGAGFQCLGYRQGLHNESQYISEIKLIKAVMESLHMVLDTQKEISFDLIRTSYTNVDLERRLYTNELAGLSKKEERIKQAYLNEIDTIEEYKKNREMIAARRAELENLLANLATASLNPADYKEQFLSKVKAVVDIIESDAPYELKGEALRSIIKKIVLHKDTDTLEFHYYLFI